MKQPPPPSPMASLERDPISRPGFRSGIHQAQRSAFDLTLHQAGLELHCAGTTYQGHRQNNEDTIAYVVGAAPEVPDLGCFLVLDGLGGHIAGEVASRYAAINVLKVVVDVHGWHLSKGRILEHAIQEAARSLAALSRVKPDYHDMGTTIVGLLIMEGAVYAAHAGDSVLYQLLPGRALTRVTSVHALSGVLGGRTFAKVESHALGDLPAGATYLLCSDGVTMPIEEIEELLWRHPPKEACEALVDHSIRLHGSKDNASAIVVKAVAR